MLHTISFAEAVRLLSSGEQIYTGNEYWVIPLSILSDNKKIIKKRLCDYITNTGGFILYKRV